MIARILVVLAASALLLKPTGADAPKKSDDAKNIQGEWKVVAFEVGGPDKGPPEDEVKKMVLRFTEDQVISKIGDVIVKTSNYKLNPSKMPREIDIVPLKSGDPKASQTMPAIYSLNDDELKICSPVRKVMSDVQDPMALNRPTEFKATENTVVITFKRVRNP